MTNSVTNPVKAFLLVALGLATAVMGIYVANADDAPGAAVMGMVLMAAAVVLAIKAARDRLPAWAARAALVAGFLTAGFAALLAHHVRTKDALFPAPQDVPSVMASAPPARHAVAVDRARAIVRAAMIEQHLPGVSVAVGEGPQPGAAAGDAGTIVWAEAFGWRDVETRTPTTPATRFNIGTAAQAVAPAVASLGLTDTGTDAAKAWSPEAIGEEGEDFPPLAILRHVVWQPLGLMASDYPLPGERATFYVPTSDDDPRGGRRLMYMRDLACCAADGMAFYSTPSDLVRFALVTSAGDMTGELAGGAVMSLTTRADTGVRVVVTSNIAHADTAALATRIGEAFANAAR